MEDCCIVCAEPLEWVGYGSCGHRDVCSICIARLRFVLSDKRCCICKQECSSVFMTKAMGDFTKVIGDFETLSERKDLWFESNTQAYFDDAEHYKMIRAMCKLSCRVCEQAEHTDATKEYVKKGHVFRNLDLLHRHLLRAHKVQMCGLCLEGRKVFLGEQKLYTRGQLEHHLSKGDSEVDGDGEERGGFTGHPMCNFCRKRFYGDNELYQHMSRDHYTCHICDRLRPGRYDYYRNYDDLEAHFRHEHALCEDPECLAKKFVVFTSESELKRHNALMHGGNMSRAQRNAALQIPVSFQYRRPGQIRGSFQNRGNSQNRGNFSNGHSYSATPSNTAPGSVENASEEPLAIHRGTHEFPELRDADSNGVEASTTGDLARDGVEPSRYLTAVSGAGPSSLEASAFPPLPGSKNARRKAKQRAKGGTLSMAESKSHPGSFGREPPSATDEVLIASQWSQPLARRHSAEDVRVLQSYSTSGRSHPTEPREFGDYERELGSVSDGPSTSGQWSRSLAQRKSGTEDVNAVNGSSISTAVGDSMNVKSTVSDPSLSDAPSFSNLTVDELRMANKVLVDRIRAGLGGDEQGFIAFKDISAQFRKGDINADIYFKHITSFGLKHLVPELARLCPDPAKKRDLLAAYRKGTHNSSATSNEDFPSLGECVSNGNSSRRGKEPVKAEKPVTGILSATASLQLVDRAGHGSDGEVEVLSKDGYRDLKGKKKTGESSSSSSTTALNSAPQESIKVLVKATQPIDLPSSVHGSSLELGEDDEMWSCDMCTLRNKGDVSHCAVCGASRSDLKLDMKVHAQAQGKRKKKISKFERARLDDGSSAISSDSTQDHSGFNQDSFAATSSQAADAGRSRGRGVWKNGGGQRLVGLAQRDSIIEAAWRK